MPFMNIWGRSLPLSRPLLRAKTFSRHFLWIATFLGVLTGIGTCLGVEVGLGVQVGYWVAVGMGHVLEDRYR